MRTYHLAHTPFIVSRLALGCLGLGKSWDHGVPLAEETIARAMVAVRTALDEGINFFDHANIYAAGKSEQAFSRIWRERPALRAQVILQSKCGIIMPNDPSGPPGRYDFSYEHIMASVEGSLRRLGTDHLDILLLHRPDPLVEPEEVARALEALQGAGKVRFFGVSNHTPWQIELLKKCVKQPFVVNQLELNIVHNHLINAGVITNQDEPDYPVRGEGTLEYCRLHDIRVQAWSPLCQGYLSGRAPQAPNPRLEAAAQAVAELAHEKGVSREAIVIAWLLRHPAGIQPIVGTTDPLRLKAACEADGMELTRKEWYRLLIAGRGAPMP